MTPNDRHRQLPGSTFLSQINLPAPHHPSNSGSIFHPPTQHSALASIFPPRINFPPRIMLLTPNQLSNPGSTFRPRISIPPLHQPRICLSEPNQHSRIILPARSPSSTFNSPSTFRPRSDFSSFTKSYSIYILS
jgi:hypothetical protein